jgi:hypothetical protein
MSTRPLHAGGVMIEIVVSKRNGRPGHSNIRRPPLVATEPETVTGRSRRRQEGADQG